MNNNVGDWWGTISLRTKMTGVTVLLITLGLLVAGVGTMSVLRNYLQGDVDTKIVSYASTVQKASQGVAFSPCDQPIASTGYLLAVVGDAASSCTNLPSGADTPDFSGLTLEKARDLADGPTPFTVWSTTTHREWRAVDFVAQNDRTGTFLTVVIGMSMDDTNDVVARFIGIFLGFGISIVILGAALTRLLVTSTFTPLREVEATAAAIADGDFSQRLPGATPNTEVGRLNRSLNTMLNRIDRAFADRARTIEQMRRFVGDASHELRTPLVSVRGYAELYRMGALQTPEEVAQAMERIEKEAIRMGGLVEDLLELARLDEAKPLQLTPVDLLPIARDAAMDAMAQAPDRDVAVTMLPPIPADPPPVEDPTPTPPAPARRATTATSPIAFAGATLARLRRRPRNAERPPEPIRPGATIVPEVPAIVLAEENKIRQVVTNLMGNALRFTNAGSPLELVLQVDGRRSVATLDIVDHGEGIPPQIRDKIFQRFWRADSSRARATGGSGLGLAIVSGIISAHKGSVEVRETPGGGATFRVTLPLLPRGYQAPPSPAQS